MDQLISIITIALALIIGITFHETAHAAVAWLLGDRTARERGRMSLNPLNHIDPFGTVILPLLMVAVGGPVFAFAKPVPIYLGNLKHPKRDEVLVALAGPASNILLAVIAAALMRPLWQLAIAGVLSLTLFEGAFSFLLYLLSVNLSLAFFNLIPLPPLDGSSILVLFLKGRALNSYYQIQRYAMPILIIVLYFLPRLTGIDLIGVYFDLTVYPLEDALLSWALW